MIDPQPTLCHMAVPTNNARNVSTLLSQLIGSRPSCVNSHPAKPVLGDRNSRRMPDSTTQDMKWGR